MRRKTNEEFITELAEKCPDIEALEEYVSIDIGIHCRCKVCGFDRYSNDELWKPTPHRLLSIRGNSNGCPRCAGNLNKIHEDFIHELGLKNPNIEILGKYTRAHDHIDCRCKICGYTWSPQAVSLINGVGCPNCAGCAKRTHEEFVKEMAEKNPTIKVLGKYINRNTGVYCECIVCGYSKNYNGKLWEPTPDSLLGGHGCPRCANELRTSFFEQAIYFYCRQVTKAYNRYTDLGKEIDVYLPELYAGIEYNGNYWHQGKEKEDSEKIEYFSKKGIRILTVKDGKDNSIDNDIIIHKKCNNSSNTINFVVKKIFEILDLPMIDINVEKDRIKIYEQFILMKKENSFAFKYPDKAREWDYEKNGNITPEMVSAGSNKKFWRICPECKNSYKIAPSTWSVTCRCAECSKMKLRNQAIESSKIIYMFNSDGDIIHEFQSCIEASDFLKISKQTLYKYTYSHLPFNKGLYYGCALWYKDQWSELTSENQNKFLNELRNNKLDDNTTSEVIGVSWDKTNQHWISKIKIGKDIKFSKNFKNKIDAIRFRLQTECDYYGYDNAPQKHFFERYNITRQND